MGAQFNPSLLSGWGVRPSDWSYGVSVQQELFPRASVEVGYYRRTFTLYSTGGTVTDNLAISPSDVKTFSITAPADPRLPGGGGYTISGLADINPNVFGQVEPADRTHQQSRRRHARVQRRGHDGAACAGPMASRSRAAPARAR